MGNSAHGLDQNYSSLRIIMSKGILKDDRPAPDRGLFCSDHPADDLTMKLKLAADVIEALRQAYEGTEGSATLTQENTGSLLYIAGILMESAHRTATSLPYSIIEKKAA
jgi:hypothetical protein